MLANIITLSRILFAIMMILSTFSSTSFWICYVWCGISDMVDGFIARKLQQQSETGAKLDSIADLTFAMSIMIVIDNNMTIPSWLWWCIMTIVLLRLINYSIGFYKFHEYASIHTILNKITGFTIFLFPLLFIIIGLNATGIIICTIAFLSTVEEMITLIKTKELNRNMKSIFL